MQPTAQPSVQFRRGFTLRIWIATALTVLCTACTGLPKDVDRPVSTAIEVQREPTRLSALVAQQRRAANARSASGFLLLSGPQDAYGGRLALVQAAQKTLDLQYYTIHADNSTGRLLQGVVDAARRGVRVRILLDDFHSTGRNALVMRLAFEPHIEMRMFNPVAGARDSTLGRLWGSLTDFSRVQQRMHNKLFLADNVMGVTGGRNLGDSYFGQGEGSNFVDLDVLAVGPVVADMSHSFDSYWNNARSYPVQSLITREELDRLREQVMQKDAQKAQDSPENGPVTATPAALPASARAAAASDIAPPLEAANMVNVARVWDQQPMDLQRIRFIWAPAAILADHPAKIPLEGDGASLPDEKPAQPALPNASAAAASSIKVTQANKPDTGASAALPGPTAQQQLGTENAEDADTVVEGLLQLMDQAKRELLIISPYFVPGEDMKRAFASARARGVRVRILTNSLASNDAPIAHVGYARHRRALLEMGVELYELRSEQAGLGSAFGLSGGSSRKGSGANVGNEGVSGGATGASRSMLHSKAVVLDRSLVVIGSMNLDLRSQLQNTEIALVVRSNALAEQAARQIDDTMRQGSWHVEQGENRGLVWRAPQGSGLADANADPDSSFGLRLILRLLGPLAPDRLL